MVEEADGDLMGDGVNIAARLESICEPGAICLSEQAYWQVKGRLDLAVSDLGPTQLKNIAEPIRVYSLEVGKPALVKPAAGPASEKSGPPRLSIVVLPFANIGGDPEQDYFVDGVTESLTTDLSRISGAFVIGRSTAFTYRGKASDHRQIGRELNVRYVLEGSVQRGGNRMRVNVQFIDAETGSRRTATNERDVRRGRGQRNAADDREGLGPIHSGLPLEPCSARRSRPGDGGRSRAACMWRSVTPSSPSSFFRFCGASPDRSARGSPTS